MNDQPSSVTINERQRELLDGARRFPYKELESGGALDLHIFSPPGGGSARPAIVFFFGGGFWERGELSQFAPQCLHFVERGMVAILADYRLGRERGATPLDGLEDARDAVAWICANARQLGIDRAKLVLAGASSGAHVFLAAALDPDRELATEPAAMVLFSPIVNVVRDGVIDRFGDKRTAKSVSPLHQVRKQLPPMVLFHAGDDRFQPVAEVEAFAKRMSKKKNRCELHVFNGECSSFFNLNVNANLYEATLNIADDFLVSVGVLESTTDGGSTTRLESWR